VKSEDMKGRYKEKKTFTLLSRKASASALAPSAPILLRSRLTLVSVLNRGVEMSTVDIRRKRCLPCSVGKHQPVL
jgi:hypothetical protein